MTVKERIIEFIKAIGISVNGFERSCGLSVGYLRQLRKEPSREKIKSIIIAFPQLNEQWLLTGEGEMLKGEDAAYRNEIEELTPEEIQDLRKHLRDGTCRFVPLVNIDSVGGIWSQNEITPSEQYTIRSIPFPDARPDDVAILQSGDSMSPTIPPGAILQIRQVVDWQEYFGYGNVFVLWLKDDRRITKQVLKYGPDPKTYVTCHSYNPDAADEELPRSMIKQVWKVVNVLINKGW